MDKKTWMMGMAENLLRGDPRANRVLVYGSVEGDGPVLFVKVSKTGTRAKAPDVFGFRVQAGYSMGVTQVHPSKIKDGRVTFEVREEWQGAPVLDFWTPA